MDPFDTDLDREVARDHDGQEPDTHLEAAYEERTETDDDCLTRDPTLFPRRRTPPEDRSGSGTRLETMAWSELTLPAVVARVNQGLVDFGDEDATIESVHYTLTIAEQEIGPELRYLGYIVYRISQTRTMPSTGMPRGNGIQTEGAGRVLPFPAHQRAVDDAVAAVLARQIVSPPTWVDVAAPDAPASATGSATPSEPVTDRSAELKALTTGAITRLAQELDHGYTDGFRAFLAFAARFWEYSAHNALLIQLQRPDATRVAGMRLWNQLGYTVRKGERGIWIWAPMLRRLDDADTGRPADRETLIGFRPAVVFDASQLAEIAEQPLPAPFPVLPDDAEDVLMHCIGQMAAAGIQVSERPLPPGTYGLAGPGRVILAPGGDSRNRLFVLLHELAHTIGHVGPLLALLGSASPDRIAIETRKQEAEFEAESAAYAVAAILGYEHPGARDYLLTYRATPEVLGKHLGAIQRIVQQMLALLGVTRRRAA